MCQWQSFDSSVLCLKCCKWDGTRLPSLMRVISAKLTAYSQGVVIGGSRELRLLTEDCSVSREIVWASVSAVRQCLEVHCRRR